MVIGKETALSTVYMGPLHPFVAVPPLDIYILLRWSKPDNMQRRQASLLCIGVHKTHNGIEPPKKDKVAKKNSYKIKYCYFRFIITVIKGK